VTGVTKEIGIMGQTGERWEAAEAGAIGEVGVIGDTGERRESVNGVSGEWNGSKMCNLKTCQCVFASTHDTDIMEPGTEAPVPAAGNSGAAALIPSKGVLPS
jgi:hypothetical protein